LTPKQKADEPTGARLLRFNDSEDEERDARGGGQQYSA
jgi:hypothetical protein